MDALIRFYYNVNPDTLEENDWIKYYQEIVYVTRLNGTFEKPAVDSKELKAKSNVQLIEDEVEKLIELEDPE